jgi:hypothetical protein
MATVGDVLHHLVDNSQAFDPASRVEAHKAISEAYNEDERHPSVPSPEAEAEAANAAQTDQSPEDKDAEIARLREELAARG